LSRPTEIPTSTLSASIGILLIDDNRRLRSNTTGRVLAIDQLDGSGIDALERGSAAFYEDALPDSLGSVSSFFRRQFLDAGSNELAAILEFQVESIIPNRDIQSLLIEAANGNPDGFISQLQGRDGDAFADVVDIEALVPGALAPVDSTPAPSRPMRLVTGDVQIDLFRMYQILEAADTDRYETAVSEFYDFFLPEIFTEVTASLRGQFLEAQELSTRVSVAAMTGDPFAEIQSLLEPLLNDNEDAFIGFLGPDAPFDDVVTVNGGVPELTTVCGEVNTRLFRVKELLSSTSILAFETGASNFYESFLPSIFSDVEAQLRDQFLDAQELSTFLSVCANSFDPSVELKPFLTDTVNDNPDAFISSIYTEDPVAFADVVQVSSFDGTSTAPSISNTPSISSAPSNAPSISNAPSLIPSTTPSIVPTTFGGAVQSNEGANGDDSSRAAPKGGILFAVYTSIIFCTILYTL